MSDSSSNDEGSQNPADQLFDTSLARQWKELELADEAERQKNLDHTEEASTPTSFFILSNGDRVLQYSSFLENQKYYDDLKHIDCKYIDYGTNVDSSRPILVEQDKSLGKGGLCWDAAFVLAEYLSEILGDNGSHHSIVELGAGTGLCGLLLNCFCFATVTITDLPELLPLMTRNIQLNRDAPHDSLHPYLQERYSQYQQNQALPLAVIASVLEWGNKQHIQAHGTFDIVVAADVVASLYDPQALAQTIHDLCHNQSVVYVSFKERLSEIHRQFEGYMGELFGSTEIRQPKRSDGSWMSRNHNPNVRIFVATEKKIHT